MNEHRRTLRSKFSGKSPGLVSPYSPHLPGFPVACCGFRQPYSSGGCAGFAPDFLVRLIAPEYVYYNEKKKRKQTLGTHLFHLCSLLCQQKRLQKHSPRSCPRRPQHPAFGRRVASQATQDLTRGRC